MTQVLAAAVSIYIVIFGFAIVKMFRLLDDACADLEELINSEVSKQALSDKDLRVELMRTVMHAAVDSYRRATLKNAFIQQLWLCFLVTTCSFVEDSSFESDFKVEFKESSLRSMIGAMEADTAETGHDHSEVVSILSGALERLTAHG
jgi:hypothetical protein